MKKNSALIVVLIVLVVGAFLYLNQKDILFAPKPPLLSEEGDEPNDYLCPGPPWGILAICATDQWSTCDAEYCENAFGVFFTNGETQVCCQRGYYGCVPTGVDCVHAPGGGNECAWVCYYVDD